MLNLLEEDGAGAFRIIKILIDRGADINSVDANDWRPVQYAAMIGHVELVDLLLDRGADINAASGYGETILNTTVQLCDTAEPMLRHLILKGADVELRDKGGRDVFDVLVVHDKEYLRPCIERAVQDSKNLAAQKISDAALSHKNTPVKIRKMKPRQP